MKRLLLILLILPAFAIASKKYVSTTASAGSGTIGDPWTVSQANTGAVAGDTVYFRVGTYDATDGYIDPAHDGTAGNYITFLKYPEAGRVLFSGTAFLADLSGRDYIHVEGFFSQNLTTSLAYYGKSGTGGHYRFIRDSVYNVIGSYGFNAQGNCAYILLDYCYVDMADTVNAKRTPGDGDGFVIWNYPTAHDVDNVHIRRTTFRRAYHTGLNFKAYVYPVTNVIIDSCIFIGNKHPMDVSTVDGALIQNCTMIHTGEMPSLAPIDNYFQAVDNNLNQMIWRRNLGYADSATVDVDDWRAGEGMLGFTLNGGDNDLVMKNIYLYHNTLDFWAPTRNDMAGGLQFSADWNTGITGDSVDHIRVKNNIVIGVKTTYGSGEFVVWQRDADRTYSSLDHIFGYNIFNKDTGSTVAKISTSDLSTVRTLAQLEASYPTKWFYNQYTKPASWTHTSEDYELDETDAGVDAGGALTLVNDAGGGSGTTLVVDDARYFMDGWGLITGDSIKIGSADAVGISDIVYATNTITLEASRTWSDNDEVFLYADGVTWDDIGARQLSGNEAPPLAPSAPTSSGPTGLSRTGFTASWSAVDSVSGYRLDISTDNFSTYLTGYQDKVIVDTSETLTGLAKGQTYYYRVRAYNATGTSDNSSTQTAVTFRSLRGHR